MPPPTLLSNAKNTLQMLSEKSHVGCDLLTQHSCCKDPFSLVIPQHVQGGALITRTANHPITAAQFLPLLNRSTSTLTQTAIPPATLLSNAKNTLQMPSEKSHVGCDLLTQHFCCKDPFSLVIPQHVQGSALITRSANHPITAA